MLKLKPCPFCGGEAEIVVKYFGPSNIAYKKKDVPQKAKIVDGMKTQGKKYYIYENPWYHVCCKNKECIGRTVGKHVETEKQAMKEWNTRKRKKPITRRTDDEKWMFPKWK